MITNGHGYLDKRADFLPASDNIELEGNYFIFVEEAEPIQPAGLLGPNGDDISETIKLPWRPWRLRASGIQTGTFLEAMGAFERLEDHETVTDDQRVQRKIDLNKHFGNVPMPIFDIYLSEEHEAHGLLVASFIPGMWYWMGVRDVGPGAPGLPVFVGAPEIPPTPYFPGTVAFIEIVPPEIEERLRDIFSLVHVLDAELEEESGDEGSPSPILPLDWPPDLFGELKQEELSDMSDEQTDEEESYTIRYVSPSKKTYEM